ncbi:MAG: signal peptidase I [Chloroflexota bacterium]|nr:MAG: signal peptidase I [Chloroflexota bacterium]
MSFSRPRLRRPTPLRDILSTLLLVMTVYALVNLSSSRYLVQGRSMYPSFDSDQILYVSRLSYLLAQPQRLDIVVFHRRAQPPEDYIKRIIGLPGEIVTLAEGRVWINGAPLDEPYLAEVCRADRCADHTWTLGPDEFFVMGDNRNDSSDSRLFGPVHRSQLVGAALLRYWPPQTWGIVARAGAP